MILVVVNASVYVGIVEICVSVLGNGTTVQTSVSTFATVVVIVQISGTQFLAVQVARLVRAEVVADCRVVQKTRAVFWLLIRVDGVVKVVGIHNRAVGIRYVLHSCDLCFQVGNSVLVVEVHGSDNSYQHQDEQYCQHKFSCSLFWCRLYDYAFLVCAILTSEAMFTDTAVGGVADVVLIGALARRHAVISVVTLWAKFAALGSDPARGTATDSIIEATPPSVEALAVLRTVHSVRAFGAGLGTSGAHPALQTLALTGDVVAVGPVLAGALLGAVLAVGAEGAGVLTRDSSVARATRILSRHVVTCTVAVASPGTLLLAAEPVDTLGAGVGAVGARPATLTLARPVCLGTRCVVEAVAPLGAVYAPLAPLTLAATLQSFVSGQADAVAGDRVASG